MHRLTYSHPRSDHHKPSKEAYIKFGCNAIISTAFWGLRGTNGVLKHFFFFQNCKNLFQGCSINRLRQKKSFKLMLVFVSILIF